MIPFLLAFIRDVYLDDAVPYAGALSSNRALMRQIKELEATDQLPPELEPQMKLSITVLERYHGAEKDRKKTIEGKATTNVAAVTVSVALLSVSLSFIKGENPLPNTGVLGYVLIALLTAGFMSLLLGGLAAIRALGVHQLWDVYVYDEARLVDGPEDWRKDFLVRSIALNQRMTTIRSNLADASFVQVRNGLVCLAAFAILLSITYGVASAVPGSTITALSQTEPIPAAPSSLVVPIPEPKDDHPLVAPCETPSGVGPHYHQD